MPDMLDPRSAITADTGRRAVVYLEEDRALVVHGAAGEARREQEVPLPQDDPGRLPEALAAIAHVIGDVDTVIVLGREDLRLALEREIVALGHRTATIRETAADGPVTAESLAERWRRLG